MSSMSSRSALSTVGPPPPRPLPYPPMGHRVCPDVLIGFGAKRWLSVVLNENFVALLGEDVGDLARNSGHRAPPAQEEIVTLTRTAWHDCWRAQRHAPSASLRSILAP